MFIILNQSRLFIKLIFFILFIKPVKILIIWAHRISVIKFRKIRTSRCYFRIRIRTKLFNFFRGLLIVDFLVHIKVILLHSKLFCIVIKKIFNKIIITLNIYFFIKLLISIKKFVIFFCLEHLIFVWLFKLVFVNYCTILFKKLIYQLPKHTLFILCFIFFYFLLQRFILELKKLICYLVFHLLLDIIF